MPTNLPRQQCWRKKLWCRALGCGSIQGVFPRMFNGAHTVQDSDVEARVRYREEEASNSVATGTFDTCYYVSSVQFGALHSLRRASCLRSMGCRRKVGSAAEHGFDTTVMIKQSIKQSGSELRGSIRSQSKHIGSQPILRGDLDGRLNGDQLTFNAYWSGGDSVAVYTGTIGPTGRIEGTTHDKLNPGNRAAWHSSIRMNCLSIWGRR
jgi:hypothetical protein